MNDYRRLNVALTRAKKLLLLIGNLETWDAKFISQAKKGSSRFLAALLQDLNAKKDVLVWHGPETVSPSPPPEKQLSPRPRASKLQGDVAGTAHGRSGSLRDILNRDEEYCELLRKRADQLSLEQELDKAALETSFTRLDLEERNSAHQQRVETEVAMGRRAEEVAATLRRLHGSG